MHLSALNSQFSGQISGAEIPAVWATGRHRYESLYFCANCRVLFGVIVSLGRGRMGFPAGCETILLVGFLGGFTTYSSFAFQSYEFFEQGRPLLAGAYVVGTVVSGLVFVWAGVIIGRLGSG